MVLSVLHGSRVNRVTPNPRLRTSVLYSGQTGRDQLMTTRQVEVRLDKACRRKFRSLLDINYQEMTAAVPCLIRIYHVYFKN